jgi:hypothetical protein
LFCPAKQRTSPPYAHLAKKGGETTSNEIYRNDRARRHGAEPWRLRQQVYDKHFDDRFDRLQEVRTVPPGLPFKQSQAGFDAGLAVCVPG